LCAGREAGAEEARERDPGAQARDQLHMCGRTIVDSNYCRPSRIHHPLSSVGP
jgi:hypothetical protein